MQRTEKESKIFSKDASCKACGNRSRGPVVGKRQGVILCETHVKWVDRDERIAKASGLSHGPFVFEPHFGIWYDVVGYKPSDSGYREVFDERIALMGAIEAAFECYRPTLRALNQATRGTAVQVNEDVRFCARLFLLVVQVCRPVFDERELPRVDANTSFAKRLLGRAENAQEPLSNPEDLKSLVWRMKRDFDQVDAIDGLENALTAADQRLIMDIARRLERPTSVRCPTTVDARSFQPNLFPEVNLPLKAVRMLEKMSLVDRTKLSHVERTTLFTMQAKCFRIAQRDLVFHDDAD